MADWGVANKLLNALAIVMMVGGSLTVGLMLPRIMWSPDGSELPKVVKVGRVACGSDSMGLTIDCDDLLFEEPMDGQDALIPGWIYVFRSPYAENETVVHRLVACLDDGCTKLMFKGDNNRIADPVINRSDVLYHVLRVEYR